MRNVTWSEESRDDYYENINFLLDKWSEKVAQSFINKVNKIEEQLEQNNVEFAKTDYKGVHVVPIVKQINLFYLKKSKTELEFLRF